MALSWALTLRSLTNRLSNDIVAVVVAVDSRCVAPFAFPREVFVLVYLVHISFYLI